MAKEEKKLNGIIEDLRKQRKHASISNHMAEHHGHKLAKEDCRSLSVKLINTLVQKFEGDAIPSVLGEAMEATMLNRAGDEVPDMRMRLDAVKLALSYIVGTPMQRTENVNYNMDMSDLNSKQLIEQLAKSPAMLDKVEAMIAEARVRSGAVSV